MKRTVRARPDDVSPAPAAGAGRSAIHVLANTGATGALGAAFWIAAAQIFDETTVAASIGASSLLIAVSFVTQVNLATSLSRFLPVGVSNQRHIVAFAYRVTLALSLAAAVIVVVVGLARGGSVVAGGDLGLTLVTALSIPVWGIFALQDAALVAVRKAHWLPIENGLTAAAKIALLALLIALPGRSTIMLAWTLPAIPAVYVVNRALFSRLLSGRERLVRPWSMIHYAGIDFVGAAATLLSLRIIPLIVVEITSGNEAAYVGVPVSILTVGAMALTAVSRLVLAEMSHEPEHSSAVLRRTERFVLAIFIPGALAGAALSYPVLWLAGPSYASGGSLVLALGCLGLVPAVDVECQLARLRFESRMGLATVVQVVRSVLLTALVVVALVLDRADLIGAAYAAANLASVPLVRWRRNRASNVGG